MTTNPTTTHPPNDAAEHVDTGLNPMKARGNAIGALKGLLRRSIAVLDGAANFSLLLMVFLIPTVFFIAIAAVLIRIATVLKH